MRLMGVDVDVFVWARAGVSLGFRVPGFDLCVVLGVSMWIDWGFRFVGGVQGSG